ncbi:MAG: tail fiber domain-containing protein [Desulfobacterales bacterium]|nr:tail fiber domain-containing protein [Desulfobacterales bacterium]
MTNAKRGFKHLAIVAIITLLAVIAGPAAVNADYLPGPVAAVTASASRLDFEPNDAAGALTLTVSGSNGAYYKASFAPGDAPWFGMMDNAGNSFPDGAANYELTVNPIVAPDARNDSAPKPARGATQSGGFAIVDGAIILAPGGGGPAGDSDPAGPVMEDQVFTDDLIVDGSACIGTDCANGENFGFDTLRLKENNLRIKFDDTSSTGSFPYNDWQITANDSSNGGANKFSIDDVTNGKTPFTIEANSPNNTLFVASEGRIGVGTSNPAVEVHVVDGDTTTLRLEQDGSSGWTPQVWDVAGNETNFFIRDVTNGSELPFRIQAGAPDDVLTIRSSGRVGMGTWGPGYPLHLKTDNTTDAEIVAERTSGAKARVTGGETTVEIGAYSDHQLEFTVNDDSKMVIDTDGNVGIGTDTPASTMHLETSGKAALFIFERTDGTPTEGQFSAGGGNTYFGSRTNHPMHLLVNQSEKLTIDTAGNVGIGDTTPGHPLELGNANGAHIDTSGTYHTSSSREFKEDIRALPANAALRALNDLEPMTYRYKVDKEKVRVGFIAEDAPDLVASKERKSLVAMDIVAVLTKVVKEQQETISENTKIVQEQQKTIFENSATIAELKKKLETR